MKNKKALALLILGLTLLVIFVAVYVPVDATTVPLWYTQSDSLKATISKQWLTFGKTVVNRDGRISGDTLKANYLAVGTGVSDTASFSGSALRLAIYRAGARPTDKYTVNLRFTTEVVMDSTDRTPGHRAKTDSVVFFRAPGGRSGQAISFDRKECK